MQSMANPLQNLRDIQLPPPISQWPNAVGWYFFAGVILISICLLAFYLKNNFLKNRLKKRGLAELATLKLQLKNDHNNMSLIAELSILLRRLALAKYSRKHTAGIYGEKWLLFLNQTGHTKAFTSFTGKQLITGPYQNKETENDDDLFLLVENWIKRAL